MMNVKWDAMRRAATVFLEKPVTITLEPGDLERLETVAKQRETSVNVVIREALIRGTHIEDVKEMEKTMKRLLQERNELLEKREKLVRVFGGLDGRRSTLRYRCHELYSTNRNLTINLCGHGLGSRYPELLDRYLFANYPSAKATPASELATTPQLSNPNSRP